MRRHAFVGVLVCVASALVWHGSVAREPVPRPHEGTLANGSYVNHYFDVAYPLPPGWREGLPGPEPSQAGVYALGLFEPEGEVTGTVVIAAQDLFFAGEGPADAMAAAEALSRAMAGIDGIIIDRKPSRETIAGRAFGRVDFSGAGLSRSIFITQARCHRVTFNLMANSPERLTDLAASLNTLRDVGAERRDPACVSGHARAGNVLSRIDPPAIAPVATPIPVRIVIGADGRVRHVNVIRATSAQRSGIEQALAQWIFKPHEADGRAAEVETGLLIEFTAAGTVVYSAGERAGTAAP
jgi:hypothetical protein